MAISGKFYTAVLLLFFLFAAASSSELKSPNDYTDLIRNCSSQTLFTVDLPSGVNKTGDGIIDYHSATLTHLSYVYLVFALFYLCYLGIWINSCLKIQSSLRRLHLLMGGLLLLKAMYLICAAVEKCYANLTGNTTTPDLVFYMFQLISFVRLWIVIDLIRINWSYFEKFLENEEKMAFIVFISLQVSTNLVSIVVSETGPFFKVWDEISTMADLICWGAAMIPAFLSVWVSGGSDRERETLKTIRFFIMMITIYMMFLRTMGVARKSGYVEDLNAIDAYNYLLRYNAAMELNGVLFYTGICRIFWRYFRVYSADK